MRLEPPSFRPGPGRYNVTMEERSSPRSRIYTGRDVRYVPRQSMLGNAVFRFFVRNVRKLDIITIESRLCCCIATNKLKGTSLNYFPILSIRFIFKIMTLFSCLTHLDLYSPLLLSLHFLTYSFCSIDIAVRVFNILSFFLLMYFLSDPFLISMRMYVCFYT